MPVLLNLCFFARRDDFEVPATTPLRSRLGLGARCGTRVPARKRAWQAGGPLHVATTGSRCACGEPRCGTTVAYANLSQPPYPWSALVDWIVVDEVDHHQLCRPPNSLSPSAIPQERLRLE